MIYIYENRTPQEYYSSTFAYQKPKILEVFSNLWKYLKHYMLPNLLLDQTGLIVLVPLIACMHLPKTEQFVCCCSVDSVMAESYPQGRISQHWALWAFWIKYFFVEGLLRTTWLRTTVTKK